MKIEANTPEEYIDKLPEDRKKAVLQLRKEILNHLPEGFEETMSYGMLGYVVPHSVYPPGYHVNPDLPLPFINLASQKNYIAIYHSGLYADEKLLKWFKEEYTKHCKTKLNMGKSCIRFKNAEHIPYRLIGELAGKMSPEEWIEIYENRLRKS
ncbi:DUF1801 domain-containing protein [Salegentibacter chungangensis]|uniref:DUF1801 domain-containing protein n=1 Tax=Salegentibacter chungangensis TaxID=1335724 RepID=A0ABW3NNW5_9FLAO